MNATVDSDFRRIHCTAASAFVLTTIICFAGMLPNSAAAEEHKPVFMQPAELQWSDSPALPKGVKICMLYGDPKKAEPVGFRMKLPAGSIVAPHTHPVHERVTVISGTFAMGEGAKFEEEALRDMPVGAVAIFPRGCPMFAMAREETVIQINAEGPWGITYINPADDPRNK